MPAETKENRYALFLKESNHYVITVNGIDWYDYQGFMVPAYLPHSIPEISRDVANSPLVIVDWPR